MRAHCMPGAAWAPGHWERGSRTISEDMVSGEALGRRRAGGGWRSQVGGRATWQPREASSDEVAFDNMRHEGGSKIKLGRGNSRCEPRGGSESGCEAGGEEEGEGEAGQRTGRALCVEVPLRPWGRGWGLILSMSGRHCWVVKQDRDLTASPIEKPVSVLCGGRPAGAAVGAGRLGGGGGCGGPGRQQWSWGREAGLKYVVDQR